MKKLLFFILFNLTLNMPNGTWASSKDNKDSSKCPIVTFITCLAIFGIHDYIIDENNQCKAMIAKLEPLFPLPGQSSSQEDCIFQAANDDPKKEIYHCCKRMLPIESEQQHALVENYFALMQIRQKLSDDIRNNKATISISESEITMSEQIRRRLADNITQLGYQRSVYNAEKWRKTQKNNAPAQLKTYHQNNPVQNFSKPARNVRKFYQIQQPRNQGSKHS